MKRLLLAAALVVIAGACGADDRPAATTATHLAITVEGTTPPRSATLTCGASATGTGYLAEAGAARAACEVVEGAGGAGADLVRHGVPKDAICTQQYGGPQVATITGTVDGRPVSTRIDRTNGCGIGAWDTLQPLLGPPQ